MFSIRTGKRYYIEAIGNGRSDWGDVDPVTKQTTGNYGDKYTGSIKESESVITKENGFSNIISIDGGSPYSIIDELDKKYPSI